MRAHCDIATGKIYGCKKGSWKWWHEKGHILFNSTPKLSWILMLKTYIFEIWMFVITASLVFKQLIPCTILLLATYIFITLYEEWWCNQYANSKTKTI